jgi:hypothetical protein
VFMLRPSEKSPNFVLVELVLLSFVCPADLIQGLSDAYSVLGGQCAPPARHHPANPEDCTT